MTAQSFRRSSTTAIADTPKYVLLLLCLAAGQVQAQIHKCNIGGEIIYTDQACPPSTQEPLDLPDLITVPATELSEHATRSAASYNSNRWYEGHEGYRKALRVSRAQNAPLYIYAYTDWCGFCRSFESKMLPRPKVQEVLSGYVKVRLNPEHSVKDRKLFDRWGGRGFPSFWVQKDASEKPRRARGPFRNRKLISTNEFIKHYSLENFAQ